ncbi:glutaredoxin family protein [Micrococcaceae bacterium Sec7.4]
MSITLERPQTINESPASEAATTVPTVTVFSKNDCSRCDAVEAKFTERGVPFREINVETDTAPRAEFGGKTPMEHVMENYGRSMPVVVVQGGAGEDSWNGTRYDKVLPLIQRFEALGALIPTAERAAHTSHL